MTNPFFKNSGPYKVSYLLGLINLNNKNFSKDIVNDIKDLSSSNDGDISFFHSKNILILQKIQKHLFV